MEGVPSHGSDTASIYAGFAYLRIVEAGHAEPGNAHPQARADRTKQRADQGGD